MSGPGVYAVTAACPSCYQQVQCRVLVMESGATVTLEGPAEHQCQART